MTQHLLAASAKNGLPVKFLPTPHFPTSIYLLSERAAQEVNAKGEEMLDLTLWWLCSPDSTTLLRGEEKDVFQTKCFQGTALGEPLADK